jgi:hypothetical protein
MGCSDSLIVDLLGDIPDTFTIEASSPEGEIIRETCIRDDPGPIWSEAEGLTAVCAPASITFFDFAPEEVTIALTWETGSTTGSFQPTYVPFRPNGPDCSPECETGRIELRIP